MWRVGLQATHINYSRYTRVNESRCTQVNESCRMVELVGRDELLK